MRRKARIWRNVIYTFWCSLWLMAIPVWAGEVQDTDIEPPVQRVYDMADLFTDREIADMETDIANRSKTTKLDLVVVTTEDAEGKTTQQFADDFYDQGDFGFGNEKDGVLFLIDMDHRQLTLSTAGRGIRLLTDSRIENILDAVYEGASQDDFVDSVYQFLEQVSYYHEKGIESNQYNYDTATGAVSRYKSIRWYEVLLALAVSGFTGLAACAGVVNQYGMKKEKRQAENYLMAYRADCDFNFHNQTDDLINKFVTTALIARSMNNRGGPGGGLGGGSIGGRSSTHMSGGGRSHGGGSRGF